MNAAVPFPILSKPSIRVSLEEMCSMLEDATIHESVDLGNTIIHKAMHPAHGSVILVNSTAGSAVLYV